MTTIPEITKFKQTDSVTLCGSYHQKQSYKTGWRSESSKLTQLKASGERIIKTVIREMFKPSGKCFQVVNIKSAAEKI